MVKSQEVDVRISRDKVRVEGKTYYVHIVQAGETLYSISKAYGVSQSEIAIANPDIYAGLKVGQALKIPVKVEDQRSDEDYVYHIAKRKETLFGISRMYNVTMDDIILLNPEVKEGLRVSQTLRIPRKSIQAIEQQPAVDSVEFILHEVQPREGLFAISRRYGVPAKEIEFYNFDLIKDGLKLGTTLRIPVRKRVAIQEESQPVVKETDVIKSGCPKTFHYDGRPIKVSLLLPFTQASAVPDKQDEDLTQGEGSVSDNRLTQVSQLSLEFYEGFLLAVDSLKRSRVSVNLSVLDTRRSAAEVTRLIQTKSLVESDLIVGPLMLDEIKPVATFAQQHGKNYVSPLYGNNVALGSTSNIISIGQSFSNQIDIFVKEFQFDPNKNYLVIYDADYVASKSIRNFDSLLTEKSGSTGVTVTKYNHKAAAYKSSEVQEKLVKLLKADTPNVVIIPSDDEPFVTDILGSLYAVKSYYNLSTEVYGPSRWRRLKNIPIDYFFALNIHIFSPFFVDYNRDEVKRFVANYREAFKAEPTQFSFLGYDVAIYFISALVKFGVDFVPCLTEYRPYLLQSNFRFDIQPEGYTLNTNQFIIQYSPDYTVKLNSR